MREVGSFCQEVRVIHQRFLQFHWKELINFQSNTSSHTTAKLTAKQRNLAALRIVKCSELPCACNILKSSGLAPPSQPDHTVALNVLDQTILLVILTLVLLHHQRRICLTMFAVIEFIRKARGSEAGPSRWRFEHLWILVDK